MYRAYASDIVYEFVCSNGLTVSNWIGVKVRTFWGPIANKATGLTKDGIHILKCLPLKRPLVPAPFNDGYLSDVQKTANKIKELFAKHEATPHAKDWEEFTKDSNLYPNIPDAIEYVKLHPKKYVIPIFFNFLKSYAMHQNALGNRVQPSAPLEDSNNMIIEQVALHSARWKGIAATSQPWMFPRANVPATLETNDFINEPALLEEVRVQQLTEIAKDWENLPNRTEDQLKALCKHVGLIATGTVQEMVLR